MGSKPSTPQPSLFQDDTPPSLERALKLAQRVPLDAVFRQELINGHGPYWYARFQRDGRRRRVYVGSDERKRVLESAHDLVRAELARVEAAARAAIEAPEVTRLREMSAAVFARPAHNEARAVDVPIFDPKKKKPIAKPPSPKERALPRRARQGS